MKNLFLLSITVSMIILLCSTPVFSQDEAISPSIIKTGVYLGLSSPLKDLPIITEVEFQQMVLEADKKQFNEKFRERSFPYASTALPRGDDPVWQKEMGTPLATREAVLTFDGLTSPYWPTDANGDVGYNYYMQTINCVFAIYDKATGAQVAGPSFMNYLFYGEEGSECNSGDPIVLYDDQADRWLAAELSICGENDFMLIAISQTNDPTGSWYKYSFDVDDMPDYPKFGIWHDGYYMGTNNGLGDDIYVFERDRMLDGLSAQMVGFNNPLRPVTVDGFHWLLPLDNDGVFNQNGSSGLFITINDDAIGGGSDQLWIYELDVDWGSLAGATFNRILQIDVESFDSNFGQVSNAIVQPKPGKLLDAIPNGLMHRAQYRNFGTYEAIVCCHTVDVNGADLAGIRWYELRREGGDWSVRQSGTFAPDDGLSRWMGSIAMNANNEIGLGYSVSSLSEYPGIRYCGQSADQYDIEPGVMDIAESVILSGSYSEGLSRWGDYFNMAVDPIDGHFWFTAQYIGSKGFRKTKIATFGFSDLGLNANFLATPINVWTGNSVSFKDKSSGTPTSWEWFFQGGTPAVSTEQNPTVLYNNPESYDVSLTVNNSEESNTTAIVGYITVATDQYLISHGNAAVEWINSIGCSGHRTHISGSSGEVGYENLTDLTFNLEAGNSYSFQLNPGFSGRSQSEYWRMWIDFNQDGDFLDTDELVMAANRKKAGFTATVNIPTGVASGQTRMRLSMKRGSAPASDEVFPYGEVEDFTVNIAGYAPQPPVADFTADKTTVVTGGTVNFTDLSTNQPHTWFWDFESGIADNNTFQNPTVTYNTVGEFYVQLTATNDIGSDVVMNPTYIEVVNELPPSDYCEPTAINNAQYFINDIDIGGQSGVHGQGSTGYTHYDSPIFTLAPGSSNATLIPNNNKRKLFWRMWLDANGDGDFDDTDETLLAVDNVKGTVSETISIPAFTDPTRLRVSMKTGSAAAPCDDNFPGEVEDYDVMLGSNSSPLAQIENSETSIIELYPNPVTGTELHIKIRKPDTPVSIQIYNINGELMAHFQTRKEHTIIDVTNYSSGIFFLKISDGKEIVIRRFVNMQ